MATVHSSAPIWVLPGAGSSRPPATFAPRSVSRSSTMPMPTLASTTSSAASSLRASSLQRSNSIPYARRTDETATTSGASFANPTLATPLPQVSTVPRRPKTPAPISLSGNATPKRPAVLRKRGATIHVARPVTPALQTKNLNINTAPPLPNVTAALGAAEDPIKAARRTELLRAVASQVEEIEKVTDAIAAARRNNVEQARQRLRGENVSMEPPSPVVEAVLDPIPILRSRRPQARRGSIDSTLPDTWRNAHIPTTNGTSATTETSKTVEEPKRAKDWEKWAEDKVRNKRRLEDVWRKEDEEIERLLRETERRDRAQKEKDARKEWERAAFFEQERQRTIRESADKANVERERQRTIRLEQERILREEQERRRNQERRDAALAEELRQKEIEQERRRIEEETRRFHEELFARQNHGSQARTPPTETRGRPQQQTQQERPRAYFSRSRQRTETREGSGERIEMISDSDSDIFDAEWGRFAEFFKLGSMANSRTANSKFKYQSPSTVFREAWESYESRWSQLSAAQHAGGNLTSSSPPRLGFTDIPWPILHQPTRASDLGSQLTEANVSSFILSPFHSTSTTPASSTSPNNESRSRKLKIREALLRWHPDKVARILNMVCEDDRAAVKEGAEAVARHLNALLSRD
ncbi:hypothetical protein FS842_008524 [Serendipita sp. 407]|nr:hypothetical protein FRC16_008888 [Serendipita sp. 398]KAG8866183.1 hypothetical protein FRC20_008995 [Serendipita sp. 405]KAG9053205.1 hypothetical protein FS842_008524 [Serendipita sp. 407]